MKTEPTTRASFSADPRPTLTLHLPHGWGELTERELAGVYGVLARGEGQPWPRVFVSLLCFLTGAVVAVSQGDRALLRLELGGVTHRLWVSAMQLAAFMDELEWVLTPGDTPVRLPSLGWTDTGKRPKVAMGEALPADLHGVPFGTYIRIENCYQGVVATGGDPGSLVRLARLMYPGFDPQGGAALTPVDGVNLLSWAVQLKGMFSKAFPHFFRPAPTGASSPSMLDVMNNQIRALTGGDVTREDAVLATDCWRALTELDAKAREADELNRQLKDNGR